MTVQVAGINFSEEEIAALQQGNIVSKAGTIDGKAGKPDVVIAKPTEDEVTPSTAWGTAPRIGEIDKVTKPTIRDGAGTPIIQHKVTRPSPDRFNDQAMARRQLELEEEKERLAQIAQLDPQSLHNSLQALDRQVRSLKKELASLKKTIVT